MQEKEILEKVLNNTEIIKKNTKKTQDENINLKKELDEKEQKEEKRKEQLREAQKNFKKIGFSVREEVADKFEELAFKLNYPSTSAMLRAYGLLLLQNHDFQKMLVEFNAVSQKDENE